MGGYWKSEKSFNAIKAELEGRFPLANAIKEVERKYNVLEEVAKKALEVLGTDEFHHVGPEYEKVWYYNTKSPRLGAIVKEVALLKKMREEFKKIVLVSKETQELCHHPNLDRGPVAWKCYHCGAVVLVEDIVD